MKTNLQEYVWDWSNGGYNSCSANSLQEATEKATNMGASFGAKPRNVRVAKPGEINEYNRQYVGMFD